MTVIRFHKCSQEENASHTISKRGGMTSVLLTRVDLHTPKMLSMKFNQQKNLLYSSIHHDSETILQMNSMKKNASHTDSNYSVFSYPGLTSIHHKCLA